MAASKHAMAAFSAYRVEVVVLGMTLLTESGTLIGAPRTPFAVSSTRILGPLSFSVCNCNHWKTCGKSLISVGRIESDNSTIGEYHIDNLSS